MKCGNPGYRSYECRAPSDSRIGLTTNDNFEEEQVDDDIALVPFEDNKSSYL